MSRNESIRHAIHELLLQQQLGVLSTAGEDGPYASLVAFAASDDDHSLYFVTPKATRKFANLTANPRAALLVNNSVNHPEDFHEAAAVTAIGRTHTVSGTELEAVRDRYLAKHPFLESFARSPSCEFVEIQVERYILVERFQNVTEYRIGQGIVDHDANDQDANPYPMDRS